MGDVTWKNVRVASATCAERSFERRIAKVDRDGCFPERHVEREADTGEARDRQEDVAAAGVAEDQRGRHLRVGLQVEAERRQIPGALDDGLEFGLAFARDGDAGTQLIARVAQRFVDVDAAGVQLGGELVLDERGFELPGVREAPALLEVFGGGADLGPFQAEARVSIIGVFSERVGVLGDRAVVVLGMLRILAAAERRGGRAAGGGQPERDENEQMALSAGRNQ